MSSLLAAGDVAHSVYGRVEVVLVRDDSLIACRALDWHLATRASQVLLYLGREALTKHEDLVVPGDPVATPMGVGTVRECRQKDDMLVVSLDHWRLAAGQAPRAYVQRAQCTKIPGLRVGQSVRSMYGLGRLEAVRTDGTHVVRPTEWSLATGLAPLMFLHPSAVYPGHKNDARVGDLVATPYGKGYVTALAQGKYTVEPCNDVWLLANKKAPTMHLQPDNVVKIPGFEVGQNVRSVGGQARVQEVRTDGMHVLECSNWTLTNDIKPTVYANPESVWAAETVPEFCRPNERVRSPYGLGTISAVRPTGICTITLDDWKLATQKSPRLYLQANDLVPAN